MLSLLRGFARSRLAMIIIGFLIIGLSAYALPDVLSGGKPRGMISAGDRFVVQGDIDKRVDDYIRSEFEQGRQVNRQTLARSGIVEQILQLEASNTARLAYTDSINLRASNFAVADIVANAPVFRDGVTGNFDPEAYRQYISRQGMTEQRFEEGLRNDVTGQYLEDGLGSAVEVPEALARIWVIMQAEQRDYAFVRLAADGADAPSEPTEEELTQFYQEHQGRFSQPERRAVSILRISADDFVDDVDVSEDDLRAEYEDRIEDFSTPSTRSVFRMQSAERGPAQEAADRIGAAEDRVAVASNIDGLTTSTISVNSSTVFDQQSIEAFYFAAPEGEVVGPVESEGQWVTFVVTDVQAGTPFPFSDVKDEIRQEIAAEAAIDLFYEAQEDFYDLVGGGLELEEAGRRIGAPVLSFAPVDPQGRTQNGDFLAALGEIPDASSTIFGFDFETQTSDILEGQDMLMVVRLDNIEKQMTPELAGIRDEVADNWRLEQLQNAARDAAENLASKARETTLESAASDLGLDYVDPDTPMTRRSLPEGVSRQTALAILDASPGDIVVVEEADGSRTVVLLKDVSTIDEASIPLMASAGKRVLAESIETDLKTSFYQGVQQAVEVEFNSEAIDNYISTMAGDQ